MEDNSLSEIKHLSTLMGELLAKLGSTLTPPEKLPPDKLINIQNAAGIMDVSLSTVKRRIKAGIVHSDKILGMRYFSQNQVTEIANTLGVVKPKKEK
jgi:hypothetical protein